MPIKWKREHIEKFIFWVQQHSCLYSVKSVEHLDRSLRANAFNEILLQMRECIPNISIDDMKKKLKNLRTQYMHEERMVNQWKESGCGRHDMYVPKLWCYDQLSFLNNGKAIKPSKDKIEATNNLSTREEILKQSIVIERCKDEILITTPSDRENAATNICKESRVFVMPATIRPKIVDVNQKIKWKREHIEKFIFYVQQHSCLYNTKSLGFLDRHLRAQAFNKILAQMQESIPNISVDDMKKKLKNLRTQYMHEQRIANQSKVSGCGKSKLYVPKLWCYDQLTFLKNHEAITPDKNITQVSNVQYAPGILKPSIVIEKYNDDVLPTQSDSEITSSSFGKDSSLFERPPWNRPEIVDVKQTIKWRREHIQKFICCVQQHSCLYNTTSLAFLDRSLRAQAFNKILVQMQECIPNISIDDMKRKLKNLRTQYMHEERMVKQAKKSGRGRSDIYIPKLWCYAQLSFLKNKQAFTTSKDNMQASNAQSTRRGISKQRKVIESCRDEVLTTASDSEYTSSSFCRESSPFEQPARKRPKKVDQMEELIQEIKSFKNCILSERRTPKKFEWLGNLVASQLEEIDPEYQQDAAWTIQCLMRELKTNSQRKTNTSASSTASNKNVLELSMAGVFKKPDFM